MQTIYIGLMGVKAPLLKDNSTEPFVVVPKILNILKNYF